MSWSVRLIGKPENIIKALEEQSAKETGQCKVEFDAALPHLVGLVSQNFNHGPGSTPPVLQLVANGSGYRVSDGPDVHRSCHAKVEQLGGTLV